MKRRLIIISICCSVLIIPFALYLFIPYPQIIPGLSGGEAWLNFWGSYLGGIVAASVAFITLITTNKRHNIQLEINEKEKELEYLKQNLGKCLCSLNMSKISAIAFYLSPYMENNQIPKSLDTKFATDLYFQLNDYCCDIENEINNFGVIYQPQYCTSESEAEFISNYSSVVKDMTTRITEIQVKIRQLIEYEKNDDRMCKAKYDCYKRIYNLCNPPAFKSEFSQLQICANAWIKSVQKQIDDLKSQQVSIFN